MGQGGRGRDRGGTEIEFLPPDAHAFSVSSADGFVDVGDDRPDQFDDDLESRSPWTTLATAAAVLALFAGGLVLAEPWKTEPAAPAATPTTTMPTTTVPQDPATTAEITIDAERTETLTAGYVSTAPPPGFEVAGLFVPNDLADSGWVELRIAPDARRESGRWLAVVLGRADDDLESPNARRVDAGPKGTALFSRSEDGVATLSVMVAPGISGILTGGGWSEAELVEIAVDMGHVGFQPSFGSPLVDELELVGSMPTSLRTLAEVYAFGDARGGVIYRRLSDGRFIQIGLSTSNPFVDALSDFVLAEAPDFPFSGASVRIAINGRRLTAGVLPELADATVARWVDGLLTISVVSNLDLVELLDVVATVEGASGESWRETMSQARAFGPGTRTAVKLDEAGAGTLIDGSPWKVDIDARASVVTLTTGGSRSTQVIGSDDPPLHVFSTTKATVVIAVYPSMDGAGQVLHVAAPSGDVDVALEPAGAIGTPWVAAHVFNEPGPFAASIVDRDGVVLESFTSPADGPPG